MIGRIRPIRWETGAPMCKCESSKSKLRQLLIITSSFLRGILSVRKLLLPSFVCAISIPACLLLLVCYKKSFFRRIPDVSRDHVSTSSSIGATICRVAAIFSTSLFYSRGADTTRKTLRQHITGQCPSKLEEYFCEMGSGGRRGLLLQHEQRLCGTPPE